MKSAAGQVVAKAGSEKQAAKYAREWDDVVGARASEETYERVMHRLEQAHGIGSVMKAEKKPKTGVSRRRCGACGKYSKALSAAHNWCTRCGHGLNGQGAAKAGSQAVARCSGCGLRGEDGAKECGRCGRKLPPASLGESGELDKSFTCAGCGSKVHADREACPHCGQIADVQKSAGPAGVPGLDQLHLQRLVAKAQAGESSEDRVQAIEKLLATYGKEVATELLSADLTSPTAFTRAFVSQGRAPLSAPQDQRPRVPQTTHAISSDQFTRGPLTAGHQRPPQLIDRLNSLMEPGGGQAVGYRSSPGIAPSDPYEPGVGPDSSTVSPGLARVHQAQAMLGRPPAPGDARPW